MQSKNFYKFQRGVTPVFYLTLIFGMLFGSALIMQQSQADASSHREAPLISKDPTVDNTDTYVFISPTNPDNLVLIASWIPFESPEGGPNYFSWDDSADYQIYIDNNGDAVPDITYRLTATNTVQVPLTFLYNTGPITAEGTNWNRQQRYRVLEVLADGTTTPLVDNVLAAPVNIGSKSTPNYVELSDNFIHTVEDQGDEIKIYAGQTDDPFWVDLQVFDLLTLRGQDSPIGYENGNNIPLDSLSGFNVHSLVIEVPISRVTQGDETVVGVWAATHRPAERVLTNVGGLAAQRSGRSASGTDATTAHNPIQVSRLGMPLVNEAVLPYALKDAFNTLAPSQDLTIYTHPDFGPILQESVENPELGRLLCALYGVPLPGVTDEPCNTHVDIGTPRSGRGDIFDIFLTGMVLANEFTIVTANGPVTLTAGFTVNRPSGVVPAEMIRINTAIKGDLCSPEPHRLGVLAGDACGFPNGRRLIDDVVEIELLAVAGAAYEVLDDRDEEFSFDPVYIGVLDDGIDFNDISFRSTFPYLATAHSGQERIHTNPTMATE